MDRDIDHFLSAGHGRSYHIIKQNPEKHRDKVLDLCTRDSSFDLQCEGSRAHFVYDLITLYDDITPFEDAATERFLSEDTDSDWHTISHLCDLLTLFEEENGSEKSRSAILEKYHHLHDIMMTRRYSLYVKYVAECFEYISISLISRHDIKYAKMIACDFGAWFIRRRKADREDLKWFLGWLWNVMQDEFGEELDSIKKENDRNIKRFFDVMTIDADSSIPEPKAAPTAAEVEDLIDKGKISNGIDILKAGVRRMEKDEKIVLAEKFVNEKDEDKKSALLSPFTYVNSPFPLDVKYLIDCYNDTTNERLKHKLLYAMDNVKDTRIGEFAASLLEENDVNDSYLFIGMILNNYSDDLREIMIRELNNINIDPKGDTDWHSVVLDIVNNSSTLPDFAFQWVYENSLCSCCRRYAVETLMERNVFPDEWKEECLHDCNDDIRDMFLEK